MEIRIDDLRSPEVTDLLRSHLALMRAQSPPESTHALDVEQLRAPEVTFWSAWLGRELVGTGALKELSRRHGEIKSMHTKAEVRGQGVGQFMLDHIVKEAISRRYQRLSLETGSMPAFGPARALYGRNGFKRCHPFADYRDDPNSVFMTRVL